VTELLPDYGDGYINSARVLIEEGEFVQARERLNRALMLEPGYPKANYFLGVIAKMEGDFEKAIDLFLSVRETNPRDRKLLKNLGQAHYFSENWEQARSAYEAVLEIDPEDDDTHYNLMLINRNLGNMDRSRTHSKKYLKYKPDEVARSISQSARLNFPHANNEAQPVHSHPLTSPPRTAAKD
jgi:tetratricopeptide (TPR) repeat protein